MESKVDFLQRSIKLVSKTRLTKWREKTQIAKIKNKKQKHQYRFYKNKKEI